jgi:hypothetical protein
MTEDGTAIVNAINDQTTTVTGSVYGYINDSATVIVNSVQSEIIVWATLLIGCFVGYLMAKGIVDPWQK